jgi:adenine-specific DNA-methyltransferase
LAQVAERVRGIDLDPAAAWLSQVMVDAALLPWTERSRHPAPRIVQIGDSLDSPRDASYDLVMGNPPYGTVRLSAEQKTRFAQSTHGRANLYAMFLDQGIATVRPSGIIAFVTPTSWVGGEYFKKLRG